MKPRISRTYPGGPRLLKVAATAIFCTVAALSADRLSVGDGHVMVVGDSGNLWAWGANASGQLGDGSLALRSDPVRIGTETDWTAVAAGGAHSLALREDGSLWAWGANGSGQLGVDSVNPSASPIRVGNQNNWVAVAASGDTSLALRADGSLWGWGGNQMAQLGRLPSQLPQSRVPVRVGDGSYSAVALGPSHVLAVGTDGRLYAWGSNGVGQLGIVETDGTLPLPNPIPRVVGGKSDWVFVSAGGTVSFGIDASNRLYSWGTGLNLGLGEGVSQASTPTRVAGTWSAVEAGDQHAVALSPEGRLFGWGLNARGQLGQALNRPDGQPTFAFEFPVPIELAEGGFTALGAGTAFTAVLTPIGTVHTTGSNDNALLGIGSISDFSQRDFLNPSNFGIPNLALVAVEVLTEEPTLGQVIDVRVEVENRGSGSLLAGQAVPVVFELSVTGEPDEEGFALAAVTPAAVLNDPIGAGQTVQRTFSITLRDDVPDGAYFLVAEVNPEGTLNEPTFEDNRSVSEEPLVFQPDITGNIAFESAVRNRGESVAVTVTFRNEGNSVIPTGLQAAVVAVDRNANLVTVDPIEIARISAPSAINPDQSLDVAGEVSVPALLNPSIYNLGVVFDPDGTLDEPNVDNNYRLNMLQTLSIPPTNPTLMRALGAAASGFTPDLDARVLPVRLGGAGAWYAGGDPSSEASLFAQAPTYIDDGEEAYFEIAVAGPFRIRFDWAIESEDDQIHFTVDGAPPLDDFSRPLIASTQSMETYEAIVSAGPAPRRLRWTYIRGSGAPAAVAMVDSLELTGVATPDLVVTDLQFNSDNVEVFVPLRRNEFFDISVAGINAGRPMPPSADPDSHYFEVEVRLTKDTVWGGPDDVVLGVLDEIERLDSTDRFLYGRIFEFDFCIPEGEYYVAVYVDSTQRFEEFNERNNIMFSEERSVVIEHRPQIEVENVVYRPGIYYRRSILPVEFDLVNTGCADLLPGQTAEVLVEMHGAVLDRDFNEETGVVEVTRTVQAVVERQLASFSDSQGIPAGETVRYRSSLQIPHYNEPAIWRAYDPAESNPADNAFLAKFPGFGLSVKDDTFPVGAGEPIVLADTSTRRGGFLGGIIPMEWETLYDLNDRNLRFITERNPVFFGLRFTMRSGTEGVAFIYDALSQRFAENIFIGPTPVQQTYADWQRHWSLAINQGSAVVADDVGGPFDDADGDGYANLIEWAFAQNPLVPDLEGKPTIGLIEINRPAGSDDPGDFFTQVTFNALSDYSNSALTYVVEAADDLAFTDPFTLLVIEPGDGANQIRGNTVTHFDDEGNETVTANVMAVIDHHYHYRVTVRDIVRVESNGQRFVRVLVLNGE